MRVEEASAENEPVSAVLNASETLPSHRGLSASADRERVAVAAGQVFRRHARAEPFRQVAVVHFSGSIRGRHGCQLRAKALLISPRSPRVNAAVGPPFTRFSRQLGSQTARQPIGDPHPVEAQEAGCP